MTIRKFFGTDGVRGRANAEPMTPETAMRLGMAAGRYFTRGDRRHTVVIGKDTRLSGYMLEPALVAGFVSMGMDVILVGPIPTPGIYTGSGLDAYRRFVGLYTYEGQAPLHGSYFSEDVEDYYVTPYELGYGRVVNFDHDFVGKAALQEAKDGPRGQP